MSDSKDTEQRALYLISYAIRSSGSEAWSFCNAVTDLSPAAWLIQKLQNSSTDRIAAVVNPSRTASDIVFLGAVEVSPKEHEQLKALL